MKKEMKMQSIQLQRKRKFLVMLPVLVFPFITLMFWSVGVIGSPKKATREVVQKGFNMNLPGALPAKDSNWNKLKFYEQADKDSAKYKSLLRNDPYLRLSQAKEHAPLDIASSLPGSTSGGTFKSSYDPYPGGGLTKAKDPNEEKVYKKLAELNDELNKASSPVQEEKESIISSGNNSPSVNSEDIDRLESMMQQMQTTDGGDPQLDQLNGMLEKIMDIQHPERVKDRIKSQSEVNKTQVFPVTVNSDPVKITLFGNTQSGKTDSSYDTLHVSNYQPGKNRFYSLNDESISDETQTAIRAIIPETQTLVSGATVKLRLADDIYIQGILIPKDEFVFGTASLNSERLTIDISSVRYKNNILPVALSVYDMDGMEGIYMPGAITRDVAKQSTDQAIQSLSIATLDPSLGAQAASAGIQAVKSLIGKKAKLVKVTVRTGYEVLLRDNNKRQ